MYKKIDTKMITAIILAGGQGKRMGGVDKGLILIDGKPIIETILIALNKQVKHIIINANQHISTYLHYNKTVVPDTLTGFQGPLAGIASAMKIATTPYVLTLPCDAPYVAPVIIKRLTKALTHSHADIAVAHDGERLQPIYALIPIHLQGDILQYLKSNKRSVKGWLNHHSVAIADLSDYQTMFVNLNTPDEKKAYLKNNLSNKGHQNN